VALSRLACGLPALRNQDTKQINTWEFALQPLPQSQGTATWICTRADRWDGTVPASGKRTSTSAAPWRPCRERISDPRSALVPKRSPPMS